MVFRGVVLAVGVSLTALVAAAQTPPPNPPPPTSDDLFTGTVVQEIRLAINSKDWQKLKESYLENTYYPCDFKWQGMTVRNVGIRSRGSGSRSAVKPGLRVDFDRYATKQEFLGLKSLVLDNLTQDPSMVKERVSMLFFQKMGLPAPREVHVKLYVNNEYIGLYVLVESIDKTFLKRVFGEDANGNVENDGYLFEYKWKDSYHFEYLGGDLEPYAELFNPKTHESAPAAELYQPVEEMIRTINEAPGDQFLAAVGEYLDLRLFVTHVAIENFLAEFDGILGNWGMNNFYFYRFERKKLSQFLVWDKDNAFWEREYPINQGTDENVLMRRALGFSELRDAYLQALMRCAEIATTPTPDPPAPAPEDEPQPAPKPGWLEEEVARELETIRAAAYEDVNKPFDNERFEDEAQKVLRFARERANYVRNEAAKTLEANSTSWIK